MIDVAVTVAQGADHLVAHVVGRVPEDFTESLSRKLPAHMVPGRALPVDALPLTVNGKLDRKALAKRSAESAATAASSSAGDASRPVAQLPVPLHGPGSESALAMLVAIFTETLPGVEVDADTDFFRAGGDSIVAITVINRARALGMAIAPRDVFLLRTPRALAGHLATSAPQAVVPAPDRRADGPLVPTPIILRQRQLGGSLTRFAQARTLPTPEAAGLADVERAANAVVAAHPALRLRLRIEHGVWALRTEPHRDVTVVRPATPDSTAAANEAAGRLDPESGEVIAFAWLEPTRTLVVTVHHLAVDSVSWLILLDDLAAALRGEPSRRRPLPTPSTPRRWR